MSPTFQRPKTKKLKNMKSVMQHQFSQVPRAEIPRSTFNRTHGYKTTFDSGYLIPFYVDEALPGDTFKVDPTLFARMATPIYPIMDNLFLETFYFAVPLRLLWDNFEKFMGSQDNPNDSTDFLVPTISPNTGGFISQSLEDYFGLPVGVDGISVNSLHHRAYNLIWNEWFRDQNLQDSVTVDTDDGPDTYSDYTLLRRGKRHDYFTSALPWPQKGTGVELPLGDRAYVKVDDISPSISNMDGQYVVGIENSGGVFTLGGSNTSQTVNSTNQANSSQINFYADLSTATASTINSLREAFQLQRMLEKDARGGTRYTEVIQTHFSVTSPDARLQRPEYLGGGSSPIVVNPVAQTTSTDVTSPQGNLAGYATATQNGRGFVKSFTEHCVIIGLLNVRADLTYQQGIPRMFSRQTRYDFYWPSLAHLGEQEILNKEIYAQGTSADEDVFGYQERYAEYRYFPSKITGKMRSSYPQTLDAWHLSQDFASLPALNSTFIEENPPVDRVIAVPSEPQFILDSYIQCQTTRPMPVYSVPGQIDHF
jgi:hypothetical protein